MGATNNPKSAGGDDELELLPIEQPLRKSVAIERKALELQEQQQKLQQQRQAAARAVQPAPAAQKTAKPVRPQAAVPAAPGPLDDPLASPLSAPELGPSKRSKQRKQNQQVIIGIAAGVGIGVVCLGVFLVVRQARQLASGVSAQQITPQHDAPPPPDVSTAPPGGVKPAPVGPVVTPVNPPVNPPNPGATNPPPTQPNNDLPKTVAPPIVPPQPNDPSQGNPPRGFLPTPTQPFQPQPGQPGQFGQPGQPFGQPGQPPALPPLEKYDPLPAKPKPEPDKGAFALMPPSVELPAIGASKLAAPTALGRIELPADGALTLSLLSDIEGLKSGFRYYLEAAPGGKEWDVFALEFREKTGDEPLIEREKVARFSVSDGSLLKFAWHDTATAAVANPLRNNVLVLESSAPERVQKHVSLRSPQVAAVNRFDPDREEIGIPLKGEALPDRNVLRLALTEARGFSKPTIIEPDNPDVGYRGQVRLVMRNATNAAPGLELRFKLQSGQTGSGAAVQISSLAVDNQGDTFPFHQSRIHNLSRGLPQEMLETRQNIIGLQNEILSLDRQIRLLRLSVTGDLQEANRISFNIATLTKQGKKAQNALADRQKKLVQQERLLMITPGMRQYIDLLQASAEFNYRVYFLCGGREVNVLTSE